MRSPRHAYPSHQLSAISYQLSAISYQLSAISYQLSAISYQRSRRVASFEPRAQSPECRAVAWPAVCVEENSCARDDHMLEMYRHAIQQRLACSDFPKALCQTIGYRVLRI